MADPVFTRHVDKLWPEPHDLIATGDRVEALIASQAWTDVMAVLDAEVAGVDAKLDSAREPLTQADYALAHGRRDGLRAARRVVDGILDRYHAVLEQQRQVHEADDADLVSRGG